jgi:hypothetical protein
MRGLIRKAELATQGRPKKGDNITFDSGDRGTSKTYAIRRLRRDRPDLHARVLLPKGDPNRLSASAAALAAGWRHPTLIVRADDPEQAARILRNHYKDPEQLKLLAKYLLEASE